MSPRDDPAAPSIRALVESELEDAGRHLAHARTGKDRALHRLRKTLQRLRAIVRLFEPLAAALAQRENERVARWRRRLAPLRDAAARRQTFLLLATRPRWKAFSADLRLLAQLEAERHRAAWAGFPPTSSLWTACETELAGLRARAAQWPLDAIDADLIERVLRRAARRLARRRDAARGEVGRELRHELRRKLRRYANLRRAAAQADGRHDDDAEALLALAKRCGHEGDLWMAVVSARREARTRPALRPVQRALEAERRALCRRHDRVLGRLALPRVAPAAASDRTAMPAGGARGRTGDG
jgi:hypothetical protein